MDKDPIQPEPLRITVEIREVYGKKMYYPHCAKSKVFASITNTVTLSETNLRRIRELGYGITVTYTAPSDPTIFE